MPMVKKINAVQKLYYQRMPDRVKQEGKADLLELTDWLVSSTPCCNHDAQNALCWATTVATGNEDSCLKSLYSVLAALKQGYSLLLDHLPSFLQKRLRYRDLSFDRQTNYISWTALDVPSDTADELADLNLHIDEKYVYISVCEEDSEARTATERVATALLDVWRFRKFTKGRWTTIGSSCRSLLASLSSGLGLLLEALRQDPAVSDHHLSGFDNLQSDLFHYVVVASLSAHVVDVVLIQLLQDERLLRQLSELEAAQIEEFQWLCNLPYTVFERLALIPPNSPTALSLRSSSIWAACIAGAYLKKKSFAAVQQYPWKLASGNVLQNICELQEVDAAELDPVSVKIQQLFRLGYPPTASSGTLTRDCLDHHSCRAGSRLISSAA